jgi:hypothetical protein
MPGDAIFDDVLAANEEYARGFRHKGSSRSQRKASPF